MNRPETVRSVPLLAATFIAAGTLWSGADGIGVAFGAIIGALIFATLLGVVHLGAFMTGLRS